jgi:RNA polymerase sigma-70 factor (ECF subfamily)
MLTQVEFDKLIGRIRSGDEQAATELVRLYEPLIRREVRLRIRDRRLLRLFDSTDVSQSVLASFFARTALGAYDLDTPVQLVHLLVSMTRNKVATAAQRQRRQKRDNRRTNESDALEQFIDPGTSPSQEVTGRELMERFRAAFTDEERAIADRRRDGLGWAEIVAQLGGTEQSRRMQLVRAVDRLSRQFGLDESAD